MAVLFYRFFVEPSEKPITVFVEIFQIELNIG